MMALGGGGPWRGGTGSVPARGSSYLCDKANYDEHVDK